MTGYDSDSTGLMAKAADFLRLRGRLEASPFHFINLGVLAYIGMGQVRRVGWVFVFVLVHWGRGVRQPPSLRAWGAGMRLLHTLCGHCAFSAF